MQIARLDLLAAELSQQKGTRITFVEDRGIYDAVKRSS